jgi:glycosyltransferase involved in cell wall biosynthesis
MFSVIIPTKDRPQFLRQAVLSVLGQSLTGNEIIVVNDGDGPVTVLDGLPVRIIDNEQRGPVAARRLGVKVAAFQHIAFLDDDDWWLAADHLERAAQILERGASFCFADGILRFEPDASGVRPPDIPFAENADALSLEVDNTILISSVCYRRNLHEALGDFDLDLPYYWDWDWYLRVARAGHQLHRLQGPAVAIRVHRENMSGAASALPRQANLEALARKHGLAVPVLKNHLSLAIERQAR